MGLFSALPVDSSWSCEWDSDPAQEQGPSPAPAQDLRLPSPPFTSQLEFLQANIFVLVIQGVRTALPGARGTSGKEGLSELLLLPPPLLGSGSQPSLPTHSTAGDLQWSQSLCLHLSRAEVATCKKKGAGAIRGSPHPDPSLGGPNTQHSALS